MSNKPSSGLFRAGWAKSTHLSSQTVRAIIGGASLVVTLALGVPWISEYMRLSSAISEMDALHSQLQDVQLRKEKLTTIESTLSQEMADALSRSIHPDDVERVRENLVGIVRDSNASLRRLEIGENLVRPWGIEHDDPLKDTSPGFGLESAFLLHKHTVQLQADGSLESAKAILTKARETGWLMSTTSLTLVPNSVRESPVTLQVQWILFGLEDAPPDEFGEGFEDEDFAAKPATTTIR